MANCDCGSNRAFDLCCGPLLARDQLAPTAEALMRSRFVAYARAAVDYLEETSAGEALRTFDRQHVSAWARSANFTTLQILATERGGPEDDEGIVEFTATYEEGGRPRVLRERSRFARIDGAWRYTGGTKGAPKRRETPKVGRNDPCPCESGKKYKRCCGR